MIFEEGQHGIVGQAIPDRQVIRMPVANAKQPAVMRADPERAGVILEERVDSGPREVGKIADGDETIAGPARQAVVRVQQQGTADTAAETDGAVRQTVLRSEDREGAIDEARQAASRRGPHPALGILEDAAYGVAS